MAIRNENSMRNRILSGLLAFIMIMSVMPLGVFAVTTDGGEIYTLTVTDNSGNPISGAAVELSFLDSAGNPGTATKTADDSGKVIVVIPAVADQKVTATVKADGYKTYGPVAVSGGETTIKLAPNLDKISFKGIVTSENGEPVAGAEVIYGDYKTKTTEKGQFTVAAYNTSSFITIKHEKYATVKVSVTADGVYEVTMTEKQTSDLSFSEDEITVKFGELGVVNPLTNEVAEGKVTYTSSAPEYVSVGSNGELIIGKVTEGEAVVITAEREATDNYFGSTATYKVIVAKGVLPSTPAWTMSEMTNPLVWSEELTFLNPIAGDYQVEYSSSNAEIAEVSSNGTVTIKKPGEVQIFATVKGGANYEDFTVAPYVITIDKAEQDALEFDRDSVNVMFGNTDKVTATGGTTVSETNKITYTSDDDSIVRVDAEGNLTVHKAGSVTITATLAGNEYYNDVTATCTVVAVVSDNTGLAFEKGDITVTYGEAETVLNAAKAYKDAEITYVSSDVSVATVDGEGNVTVIKPGTVTITASIAANDQYEADSAEYTIVINKADQNIKLDKPVVEALTYKKDLTFENKATASTAVTYKSSAETIATVDENGVVTILKSGVVTITVSAAGNDFYNAAEDVTYTINVNKGEQTIVFKNGEDELKNGELKVTFNDNDNKINVIADSEAISDPIEGEEVEIMYTVNGKAADFDKKTGAFTVTGAGDIVVSVVILGNEKYNMAMGSYRLTVERDDQTIAFPESSYDLFAGVNFETAPVASETSEKFGEGEITYLVTSDENGAVSAIDPETAALTLTNIAGKVVVTATKAADANYNEATATYTLNINYWKPADDAVLYTLEGEEGTNGWFRGNVSIKAAEGYSINTVIKASELEETPWTTVLTDAVTTDSGDNKVTFYIKQDSTGYITAAYTETIKKDISAPSASISLEENSTWEKILTILTFNLWNPDSVRFTANYADAVSGVATVESYIQMFADDEEPVKLDDDALDAVTEWETYSDETGIVIDSDCVAIIYVKVVDNAGNVTYNSTNGIISDKTLPEITADISAEKNPTKVDNTYYDDVIIDFTAEDLVPTSGLNSVSYEIKCGDAVTKSETLFSFEGEDPDYETLLANSSLTSEIVVVAEENVGDDVKVIITAVDNAGNVSTKEIPLSIALTTPTVELEFDGDFNSIFDETKTANVIITGRASLVDTKKITITATDVNGNAVANAESLYEIGSWDELEGETPADTKHVAKVTFFGDAVYELNAQWTESVDAENLGTITVDKSAPEAYVYIAETETWSELLATLTFGLWSRDTVDIYVSANDTTTDIGYVGILKVNATVDSEALTAEELDERTGWTEIEDYTADTSVLAVSIEPDDATVIYVKVVDAAGNVKYICTDGVITDESGATVNIEPLTNASTQITRGEGEEQEIIKVFTDDVDFSINVNEGAVYSGIKSIEWWFEVDGVKYGESESLYNFDATDLTYGSLKNNIVEEVTVFADETIGNKASADYELFVKTIDNAGNEVTESYKFVINTKATKIGEIELSGTKNGLAKDGYYTGDLSAKVTFEERAELFDENAALAAIVVKLEGEKIAPGENYTIGWVENTAENVFTAKINFIKDGNYSVYVDEYTNRADMTTEATTPVDVTLDSVNPTGKFTFTAKAGNADVTGEWSELTEETKLLFANAEVNLTAETDDVTSPITVEYYYTENTNGISVKEFTKNTEWLNEIPKNDDVFKGVYYARITDYAGNRIIISTDGLVVENNVPAIKFDAATPVKIIGDVNVYTDTANVNVVVAEDKGGIISGIASIEAWVTSGEETVQTYEPYSFDAATKYDDIVPAVEKSFDINAINGKAANLVLNIKATDFAGNYVECSYEIVIDALAPITGEVEYIDVDNKNENAVDGYFTSREATVTFQERADLFDNEAALGAIKVTSTDGADLVAGVDYTVEWLDETSVADNGDTIYTAKIVFIGDANYEVKVESFENLVGLSSNAVDGGKFTVDNNKSTGTLSISDENVWKSIIEVLTFGIWSQEEITVAGTAADVTSPVQYVEYAVTDATDKNINTSVLEWKKLESEFGARDWADEVYTIAKNERATVLIRITDNAGNVSDIISTNGIIVDVEPSEIEFYPDESVANINGIDAYVDAVSVTVTVNDLQVSSGIKSIEYWVTVDGETIKTYDSFSFDVADPTFDQLVFEKDVELTIEPEEGVAKNYVLNVVAFDNAGNSFTDSYELIIDTLDPITGEVEYIDVDNKNANAVDGYFTSREATVTFQERTDLFNKEAALGAIKVTSTDGADLVAGVDYTVEWLDETSVADNGDTIYTAKIVFIGDANYEVKVESFENLVGLSSNAVDGGKFTVDNNKSTGTLSIPGEDPWIKLVEVLTFGIWSQDTITVSGTATDVTSPVQYVEYAVTDATDKNIDTSDLEWNKLKSKFGARDWADEVYKISKNERATVLIRITDNAGNVSDIISTNGIIVDSKESLIEFDFEESDANVENTDTYVDEVNVTVTVNDLQVSSGIKSIRYWVDIKDNGNADATLYHEYTDKNFTFDIDDPTYDQLVFNKTVALTIDPVKDAAKNYVLNVEVVDNAGNRFADSREIIIDTLDTKIDVTYSGTDNGEKAKPGYFTSRTATITFQERADLFKKDAAVNSISVYAYDVNGNGQKLAMGDKTYTVKWISETPTDNGDTIYTAEVEFKAEGNYKFDINYTNLATRNSKYDSTKDANASAGRADGMFAVDTVRPTGSISAAGHEWESLIGKLTFIDELMQNSAITVTGTSTDVTSPVQYVKFYKTDATSVVDVTKLAENDWAEVSDLDNVWDEFTVGTIAPNERATVYIRVTDYAGNVSYVISTNGIIVEKTIPEITIDPTTDPNANGYYNGNVEVNIDVKENDIFSGINKVEYWVLCDGKATQNEVLYSFVDDAANYKNGQPEYANLQKAFNKTITVDKDLNNSDNVVVKVEVTDNAGNVDTKTIDLKIDITKPVIEVEFDNNKRDNAVDGYFTDSTATITITERTTGFDADRATAGITVTAKNAVGEDVDAEFTISGWTTVEGEKPDDAKHTATVTFKGDANYTFDIAYTDNADNAADDYTKVEFTVDNTKSTGTLYIDDINTWDKIIDTLTFGIWGQTSINVNGTAADVTSPVQYVEYLVTEATTKAELEEVIADEKNWTEFKSEKYGDDTWRNLVHTVAENQRKTVAIRITDYAGNVSDVITSNGIIVDEKVSEINFEFDAPTNTVNGIPTYIDAVDVTVTVTDPEVYSGIKSIEYWVTVDGEEYCRYDNFSFENTNPLFAELEFEKSADLTIVPVENTAKNYVLHVETVDNAGKKHYDSREIIIDRLPTELTVEYSGTKNDKSTPGYFTSRTATLTFQERADLFNKEDAVNSITVYEFAKGKPVHDGKVAVRGTHYTVNWISEEAADNGDTIYTAEVKFVADGNYKFTVNYTNLAKTDPTKYRSDEDTKATIQRADCMFTVDTNLPTGELSANTDKVWKDLIGSLTFEKQFVKNSAIPVTGTSTDVTSPVQYVEFYKTDATSVVDVTKLAESDWSKVSDPDKVWDEFTVGTIAPNERATVYIRVTDNAGNVSYVISTNGIIAEVEAASIEIKLPEANANGFYNSDVPVSVTVTENSYLVYSGIEKIEYIVEGNGEVTTTVVDFAKDAPTYGEMVYTDTRTINVNSAVHNSNDVKFTVNVTDRAGNTSTKSVTFNIDVTRPVINVSYADSGIATASSDGKTYFTENRVATIVITERNFDPNDVVITLSSEHGNAPVISGWTTVIGAGNGDGTTHTATVTYTADDDYEFAIDYIDEADWVADEENYGNSVAPQKFTIDNTDPVVNLTYDNYASKNDNYFNADRTLTITVNEHNFDESRFAITEGAQAALRWTHAGDTHTAIITYNTDGYHEFNFALTDRATNAADDIVTHTFYVDKVKPVVNITDNTLGTAMNDKVAFGKQDISFTVSFEDVYLNLVEEETVGYWFVVENTRTGVTVWEENGPARDGNVATFDFVDLYNENSEERILADGIYTLTAKVTDKAGNTHSESKTFSVNRDSSNFVLDSYLSGVIENKFNQEISDKIIISEINCTAIASTTITIYRDGNSIVLVEGEDYEVVAKTAEGNWYQNDYEINASVFATDGNYTVEVKSVDETGTVVSNASAIEEYMKEIQFTVDKTAPRVVVSGLPEKPVDAEYVEIYLSYEDNTGVSKIVITVEGPKDDRKEFVISEEGLNALTGEISYKVLAQDDKQKVTVTVYDEAGNVSKKFVQEVTISTNAWVRFINNTPVLIATIAGVSLAVLAAIIIPIVIVKKKKKDEEK